MEIKLVQETCVTAGCGIAFWVDEKYQKRRMDKKDNFYCPNGHSMHYVGETDDQKLKRERHEFASIIGEKNAEITQLRSDLRKEQRKPRRKK